MLDLNIRGIISGESEDFAEVAPQEAEGAIIEQEYNEPAEEFLEDASQIDNAIEEQESFSADVEELEEAGEVLGESLQDPNYEGMDEVTAETLGIIVSGIRRRSGFSANGLSEISGESFGAYAGNRRMKTEIAHESIMDAVKSGWNKVLDVIKSIIDFVKDFWKKHVSTIGRMRKALKKLAKRARDTKGYASDDGDLKVSARLDRQIYGEDDIDANSFIEIIKRHSNAMESTLKSATELGEELDHASKQAYVVLDLIMEEEKGVKSRNDATLSLKAIKASDWTGIEFGSESKPLINGAFAKFKVTNPTGKNESPKIDLEWDQRKDKKTSKERLWIVSSQEDIRKMAEEADDLLEVTQRLSKIVDKTTSNVNKSISKFRKAANSAVSAGTYGSKDEPANIITLDNKEKTSLRRAANMLIRRYRDQVSLIPKLTNRISSLNVQLGSAVVSFGNMSLNKYKTDED